MKATKIVAALLVVVAPLQAQQAPPTTQLPAQLTLDEAIAIALRNNGQYLRAANDSGVLQAQSRLAFTRLLPVPGASIGTNAARSGSMSPFGSSTSSSSGTSLGLNLSLTVFDGGRTLQSYRNSKTAVQRGKLDLTDAENNTRAAVINAYFRTQLADSAIALERRILADRRTELEVAELRFRKALISPLDRQRTIETVIRAENSVANAIDALEIAKLDLLAQLGVSASTNFTVVSPIPTYSSTPTLNVDSILQIAREKSPAIKRAQFSLDQTRAQTRLTKNTRYLPTVRVSGSFGRSISDQGYSALFDPTGRNRSVSGSLNISFPLGGLVDFTEHRASNIQANASLADAQITMRDSYLTIERQVRQAILSLQQAYRSLAFAREQVQNTQMQLQVANEQLAANLVTYFAYQQVIDGAAQSQRDLLNQQLNVLTRTIALEQLLGNTPSLSGGR